MKYTMGINILVFLVGILFSSCDQHTIDTTQNNQNKKRQFKSSFESSDDFSGFYITPQKHLGTTSHELSDSIVRTGTYAHKAWIDGANQASSPLTNNNHRGYPTVQPVSYTHLTLPTKA